MNPDNLSQPQESLQPSDNTPRDTEERTISLLQKIQAGTVDPKCIRPADRRLIVNHMIGEGYSTADMAQILKVSDRSIERDKKAIREANALSAGPELVEQMVGRLVCEADLSIQRIRKAARDKETSPAVRIDAEHRCYLIVSDKTARLQSLGYLPIATPRLQADFTHSIGQIPDVSQLQTELQKLRRIQGNDPQLTEQLDQIETQLVKVGLASQIENMSKIVESREIQNESDQ